MQAVVWIQRADCLLPTLIALYLRLACLPGLLLALSRSGDRDGHQDSPRVG